MKWKLTFVNTKIRNIETNGNMKKNNYLFNYLIETNGNIKKIIIYLII